MPTGRASAQQLQQALRVRKIFELPEILISSEVVRISLDSALEFTDLERTSE